MTTQADNDQNSNGRIKDGLDNARATASQATARASETLETNPLAMLAGGLAIGAIAGALTGYWLAMPRIASKPTESAPSWSWRSPPSRSCRRRGPVRRS